MATVLGKVRCTPKGAWSDASAYEYLDIVTSGGSSYMALQRVPINTALSDTTYWMVMAEKGDQGDRGPMGNVNVAAFDIDIYGHLVMSYPDNYDGVVFILGDNGHLMAIYS